MGGELAVIGEAGQGGADSGAPVEKEEPDSQELAARAEPEPASEPKPVSKPEAPAAQASDGSSTPLLMPELGESVIEGTVTRWLKKVGDPVEVDEPLLEVSTDKVDTEIPSPVAGTLLSTTAEEGDTVAVGGELAKVGEQAPRRPQQPALKPEAEPVPEPKPEPKAEPAPEPKPALTPEPKPAPEPQPAAAPAASAPSADSGPFVTLLVRKMANKNIDLATVKATGVGGRIRKQEARRRRGGQGGSRTSQGGSRRRAIGGTRSAQSGGGARAPAWHHPEGQPDPAAHHEEDPRIPSGDRATHRDPRSRRDEIVALRAKAKAKFAEQEGVNLTFLPFFARAAIERSRRARRSMPATTRTPTRSPTTTPSTSASRSTPTRVYSPV